MRFRSWRCVCIWGQQESNRKLKEWECINSDSGMKHWQCWDIYWERQREAASNENWCKFASPHSAIPRAMSFTCPLNLPLHQPQTPPAFRTTQAMTKIIILVFSIIIFAMDSLKKVPGSALGALGVGARSRLQGWLLSAETLVTNKENRKSSQHPCSSRILFRAAQSHFLHEIVLQCLQDNSQ